MDAIGQITGRIAHDFNNLLQSIGGNLEIVVRNLPQDAACLQRAVAQATRGVRNAADLTRSPLALLSRSRAASMRATVCSGIARIQVQRASHLGVLLIDDAGVEPRL